MTLFNISLCLPELDIAALIQKETIAVMTQRFMVPNKSFALMPGRELPIGIAQSEWYRSEALAKLEKLDSDKLTHWATCTFSQQMTDESAIATIAPRTIWTESALKQFLHTRKSLFLSILRVHELPTALSVQSASSSEQLYKFMPLARYVEAEAQQPLLSDADFTTAKETFFAPSGGKTDPDPPKPLPEDILDSSDWVSKISEFGDSSDGHTFEKLVRKAFSELGFSNSNDKSEASLDPYSTGGAGGIDFYADKPYSIVGECKSTATQRVQGRPVTQLHRLGMKYLARDEYDRSLKLVIVGGDITTHEDQTAEGHSINVLRAETLQNLIVFKTKYDDLFDLFDLRAFLTSPPFGMNADTKIASMLYTWEEDVRRNAQHIQQSMWLIQTVRELSEQTIHGGLTAFTTPEIRAHHNAKHQPHLTDAATEERLKDLSFPPSNCLSKKRLPPDNQLRFSFVRELSAHS
ncbi:MAG: DUF1802 family protein [Cyanobacteria bacterium J06621_11]